MLITEFGYLIQFLNKTPSLKYLFFPRIILPIFSKKIIELLYTFFFCCWLKDKLYEQHKSLLIKCIHYPLTVTWLKLRDRRTMTFHIKRKLILNIPES